MEHLNNLKPKVFPKLKESPIEKTLYEGLLNSIDLTKYKIVTQYNVPETRYRVDFLIKEIDTNKPILIIEADGGQHYGSIDDKIRDEYFKK